MSVRYMIIFGLVLGATLVLSGCDQETPQSTYSRESVDVYDNMGRLIRRHKDGYVTTFKYEADDRRIITSTETVREK